MAAIHGVKVVLASLVLAAVVAGVATVVDEPYDRVVGNLIQQLDGDLQDRPAPSFQVSDLNGIFDSFVTIVIAATIGHRGIDASSRHPRCEGIGVVIASVLSLSVRRATELARPHDQRVPIVFGTAIAFGLKS